MNAQYNWWIHKGITMEKLFVCQHEEVAFKKGEKKWTLIEKSFILSLKTAALINVKFVFQIVEIRIYFEFPFVWDKNFCFL